MLDIIALNFLIESQPARNRLCFSSSRLYLPFTYK